MAEAVEVVVMYAAAPGQEHSIAVKAAPGATLGAVIEQSGILELHVEIDLSGAKLGVWGKLEKSDSPVRKGDRIEIYRPLLAEPNATRLARAAKKAGNKKAG